MEPFLLLVVASSLVIFSYLLDLVAGKIRIPSAISLIATGVIAGSVSRLAGIEIPGLNQILPVFGNVALILIVLEGSLAIRVSRQSLPVLYRSVAVAIAGLIGCTAAIAGLIGVPESGSLQIAILNAIPLAVISSAIAISSVMHWKGHHRDFIISESAVSDIGGIVLFNFFLSGQALSAPGVGMLIAETSLTVVGALLAGVLLILLLNRITHHIKFFLIVAILVLIVATGKLVHLSTLLVVFVFGLLLANHKTVNRIAPVLRLPPVTSRSESDFSLLQLLTHESAFIFRTFFFFIFGFLMPVGDLISVPALITGVTIAVAIIGIRMVLIRVLAWRENRQILFIAPRGLITILLFLSIPSDLRHPAMNEAVLTVVIILLALLMIPGFADRLPASGTSSDP